MRSISVVPVETGPAAKWCASEMPKLKRFGVALAIVTGGRYAASSTNPNGPPTVILGRPNTGERSVLALLGKTRSGLFERWIRFGYVLPLRADRMLAGLMTSGAVAIENTIGAV